MRVHCVALFAPFFVCFVFLFSRFSVIQCCATIGKNLISICEI